MTRWSVIRFGVVTLSICLPKSTSRYVNFDNPIITTYTEIVMHFTWYIVQIDWSYDEKIDLSLPVCPTNGDLSPLHHKRTQPYIWFPTVRDLATVDTIYNYDTACDRSKRRLLPSRPIPLNTLLSLLPVSFFMRWSPAGTRRNAQLSTIIFVRWTKSQQLYTLFYLFSKHTILSIPAIITVTLILQLMDCLQKPITPRSVSVGSIRLQIRSLFLDFCPKNELTNWLDIVFDGVVDSSSSKLLFLLYAPLEFRGIYIFYYIFQ